MNEWEFTAIAQSWMNAAITADPSLPFSEARCEQRGTGSQKRRDLTILNRGGVAVLTGEVKMPFQVDGASPYRTAVVQGAREKAKRAKVEHFFTWNVNRCVLWRTESDQPAWQENEYRGWDIADVHRAEQMQLPAVEDQIKRWIPLFLRELAEILRGDRVIERKPPDLRFIEGLEAELEQPIFLTTAALIEQCKKSSPRASVMKWMREEQGWTVADPSENKQGFQEDLARAAHFANYSLLNKVVFHEALLKRYGAQLERLDVPDHIDSGERLRAHLERHFIRAREVTGDYETVFGTDSRSVGNRIPFYADPAVAYWRMLIEQIHDFDFSKLDYEIIGAIFERLISPEERHKYGQYYTRAEVVDLINSFCIRTGKEKVLDPACGGGTFLVRAYARKRELDPTATHSDRLNDLFGVDISHFATHLTTINLATRDLIDDQNYPQVTREDFFNIDPGAVLMNLPARMVTTGLGAGQQREVVMPKLDAIVGNPPYVRQEGIPKAPAKWRKKKNAIPPKGTKEWYKLVAERDYKVDLSGRSDLHVYFWLHATEFLHHGGTLGFLTSSQWLDVDYGFRLQEFILRHFEIQAVFESLDEPWFVGARVATAATMLRRQRNEDARMKNIVRFVQLRRPIAEVLEHDGTVTGAMEAADRYRDQILALKEDMLTDQYRLRLIRQGELWNEGVRLGKLLGKSKRGPSKDPEKQQGDYYGGKWGMRLRAPDVWFELVRRYGKRFAPLGEIAEVRFGVKSGKDSFFFPIDKSKAALAEFEEPRAFRRHFGVDRARVEDDEIRIVLCGEDELRPIELAHLEPEIHSLMDLNTYEVRAEHCKKLIFLTGQAVDQLPEFARTYVEWGEREGWHNNPTCAGRVSGDQEWHDLTGHLRADIILPKILQYRPICPLNPERLFQASALLGLYNIPVKDRNCMAGILNSTIAVLAILLYARGLGNEANIQLDVYLANMMLVPNLHRASASDRRRVSDAFRAMARREPIGFVSRRRIAQAKLVRQGKSDELEGIDDRTELDMSDRWKLDDAVLRMIGVEDKEERERLMDLIYSCVRQHFELARQKEEKAAHNKKVAKKRSALGPAQLAAEIVEQIKRERPDIMRSWDAHFMNGHPSYDTFDLPLEGEVELVDDLIHANTLRFRKGRRITGEIEAGTIEQVALLRFLAEAGIRGFVRIPHDRNNAAALHKRFAAWWEERTLVLQALIEERTADDDLQERILVSLYALLPAA